MPRPTSNRPIIEKSRWVLSWTDLTHPIYENRQQAGRVLSEKLDQIGFQSDLLILAIPNGGLPVAAQIAELIGALLDAIIVRKLQVPGNPEAGFGSLTSFGSVILNEALVRRLRLSDKQVRNAVKRTENQVRRRQAAYGGLIGIHEPEGKDVILVDDGLASGYTMLAAVESVRQQGPDTITVAVPTSSAGAAERVRNTVERLVCPRIESGFVFAVANAYQNWYDVSDAEAKEVLQRFR
ncbi:phosphoribosyltransferase [Candidatus Thorarchaeota archaeon]|nr:MAG: phosphoribosyltransferase [Candidatus Thorarchaeota archaeon]